MHTVGIAQVAERTVLAGEDQRGLLVAEFEQVLGEIQPRIGKETGARHGRPALGHALAALAGDHVAELPQRRPEILRALDRETVEAVPVLD
jgi:hypothetical protein